MRIKLDDWQREVVEYDGNICLASGRQVGKSLCISIKVGEFAVKNKDKQILVISAVERQAYNLFEKILAYLLENYKSWICTGKDKPTKHEIRLKNGSLIRCYPTGLTGYGIRGYTSDWIVADEAAYIPEDVWTAITPMLATTGGKLILLSTPAGKDNFFAKCFKDENFKQFHISSEDCPRMDKEFLEREKQRMTVRQYAQEYLGRFVDSLTHLFPEELIKKCMTLKRRSRIYPNRTYTLGVDLARLGEDESVFSIFDFINDNTIEQVESIITTKTLTTSSTQTILNLERQYDFNKIGIDDGGLGVAVLDSLLLEDSTKRKVVGLNNARRSLDNDKKQRKKLLKEDMYMNLLKLMEKGIVKFLDDDEIYLSLKSIQYEYVKRENMPTVLKIHGNYSHVAESIIRAVWFAQQKSLNLWVAAL